MFRYVSPDKVKTNFTRFFNINLTFSNAMVFRPIYSFAISEGFPHIFLFFKNILSHKNVKTRKKALTMPPDCIKKSSILYKNTLDTKKEKEYYYL